MDAFDAVRTVLAVRQYRPEPVPDEILQKILESGWLTASSMNGQPWHFILIKDPARMQQLAAVSRTGPYLSQAPAAIVVAIEPSPFGVSDASRAIQSMILTAWSEGVGSNWVGFTGQSAVKPLLGIPDAMDVLAILPLGYPVKEIGQGKKKRKPFDEVVSYEQLGQHSTP